METDVRTSLIQSPYFDTKGFQRQLDIIKKASEEAFCFNTTKVKLLEFNVS